VLKCNVEKTVRLSPTAEAKTFLPLEKQCASLKTSPTEEANRGDKFPLRREEMQNCITSLLAGK
jgi:hypothetical protein